MCDEINSLIGFNEFVVDSQKKVLWFEDEPVELPLKAVELLCVLIEKGGKVVSKDELLDNVWSESFVEEGVLSQNVYQLRKVFKELGNRKDLIQTIPRRGYRFLGEVTEIIEEEISIERKTLEKKLVTESFVSDVALHKPEDHLTAPDKNGKYPNRRTVVYAVLGLIFCTFLVGTGFWWSSFLEKDQNIDSVAVLPLKNLTGNEDTKMLSLALTDNLISRLGSLNRFIVRPLNAVSGYNGEKKDAVEFGRDLKVDAVLAGTIQTTDGRLRVNLRLIDVRDGSQAWEGNFSETQPDILKLQDELSARVARSLVSRITQKENKKLKEKPTSNPEAYEAYLKGRYFWSRRTKEDLKKAISYYNRAVKLDKNFAEAYVGLADSQYLLFDYNWDTSLENPVKAKENLLKALSIKPNLVKALATLGLIRTTYDWDWRQAETSFNRALEIEPNSIEVLHRYGMLMVRLRRFSKARELLAKAREIDPLSVSINMNYGVSFLFDKKFALAVDQLKQALEIDPKFTPARWYLARCYWQKGEKDKAVREFIKALADSGEIRIADKMRQKSGKPVDKMRVLYQEWLKQFDKKTINAHDLAFSSSFLGEKELTLTWLEKSVENHDTWAAWIYSEPDFDFVREDLRFKKLMERMKFEPIASK